MKTILLAALFAASLMAQPHAVQLVGGVWVDMGSIGGPWSFAEAINSSGEIVGGSGSYYPDLAFTFGGSMSDIGSLGCGGSEARAINTSGVIAGLSIPVLPTTPPSCGAPHAFTYTSGGGMVDLDPLNPSRYSQANGVSDAGVVVGEFWSPGDSHAFSFDGSWHDLGTLGRWSTASAISPNGTYIAGVSVTSAGEPHLFSYSSGTMNDLGKPSWSCYMGQTGFLAVNDSGLIAGSDCLKAYYYDTAFHQIPILSGETGIYSVSAITASGQIVGRSSPSGHPFMFTISGAVLTDLGLTSSTGNWNWVTPRGVNANGVMVGAAE